MIYRNFNILRRAYLIPLFRLRHPLKSFWMQMRKTGIVTMMTKPLLITRPCRTEKKTSIKRILIGMKGNSTSPDRKRREEISFRHCLVKNLVRNEAQKEKA